MRRAWLAVLTLALLLGGCATSTQEPPSPAPSPPTRAASPTGAPSPAPSPTPTPSPTRAPSPAPEPLTFIEEELVGTWLRYHVKNRGDDNEWGYYQYVAFLDNRTMCEWKHGQESSTDSDDGDYDYVEHGPWALDKELGGGEYLVKATGAGIDWVFDHSRDRVYPAGYDTLWRQRATDGKTCYVR